MSYLYSLFLLLNEKTKYDICPEMEDALYGIAKNQRSGYLSFSYMSCHSLIVQCIFIGGVCFLVWFGSLFFTNVYI